MLHRPATRLMPAAVAVLLVAAPSAFAFPPIPPVKLPPVKLPPSPVIRALLPYVPYAGYSTPGPSGTAVPAGPPLKAALKEVRAAKNEVADKDHLKLAETTKKVRAAQELVARQGKIARADKKEDRAARLDGILKDLQEADRQIAAHQVDRAHDALMKAARELDHMTGDPKKPAATPKK